MSKIASLSFYGLGLRLDSSLDIDNRRPDGRYLDEELSDGIFTCMSGKEGLLFGIVPCFAWDKNFADIPQDKKAAKLKIAERLLSYLKEERSRVESDEEIPSLEAVMDAVHDMDVSWQELW